MKRQTTKSVLLVLGLALPLLGTGCASEPKSEIDAANSALEAARQAEAEDYAPEAMQIAEDAHAEMETELARQKEQFALGRSYDKARELATETQKASVEAADAARESKLQAGQDATTLLAQLRASLGETRAMLDNAPQGKGSAADLAALRGDLGAVDVAVTDIEQAISAERFLDALRKGEAALENTNQTRAEIERAAEARRTARTRRG